MRDGLKWSGKRGLWEDADGNAPPNGKAKYPSDTQEEVLTAYFDVLRKAKGADGAYDFTKYNARVLVWLLGNKPNRKLTNIRNIVSLFKKRTGYEFETLSARVKVGGLSEVDHERNAKEIFNKLKLDDLVKAD